MFRAGQIKSICFIVIASVLLMGMCPTGLVADSFFASSRSLTEDVNRTQLHSISTVTSRTVSYTQETLPEYETILTSIKTQRRISLRQGNRDYFSIYKMEDILSMYSTESGKHTGYHFDEIISHTVIIRYIHHQDGSKA